MTTTQPKTTIFWIVLLLGTLLCGGIYGFLFDGLSEENLMMIAFAWIFFLVMGISGLVMRKNPKALRNSILWGLFSWLGLMIFYMTVWESL